MKNLITHAITVLPFVIKVATSPTTLRFARELIKALKDKKLTWDEIETLLPKLVEVIKFYK